MNASSVDVGMDAAYDDARVDDSVRAEIQKESIARREREREQSQSGEGLFVRTAEADRKGCPRLLAFSYSL